jgi:hypothetical protein
MNPRAPTSILCITANVADDWYVQGRDRAEAELTYCQLILQGRVRPPLYRVVVQFRVEQHRQLPHQLSYAIN